jgi:RHS repeat-associated protein
VLLNQIDYDSYGNVIGQSNPSVTYRFGYTGREWDGETGQYYYRARYYDQTTGRFISQDPIGFSAGDANLYRYVFNSPTNFTDPSGEIAWVPVIILGGIIIPIVANMLVPPNAQAPTHRCDITSPRPWWHEPLVEAGLGLGVSGLTSAGKAGVKGLAGLLDDAGRVIARNIDDLGRAITGGLDDAGRELIENSGRYPQKYHPDLSHVTGKAAHGRNQAIESVTRNELSGVRLTFKPQYNPFIRTGIAAKNVGTQIGKNSFASRKELINTIIHEELHHRWWSRGIINHHPTGSMKEAKFYETVHRFMRMKGLK